MDRFLAMLILLGLLVSSFLIILAIFAVAPIFCTCLGTLLYTLYIFISNESHGVHHAQEFENRFWTILAILFSTALFFAKDSPIAFGLWYPSFGFLGVVTAGYGMHTWDRYIHRKNLSHQGNLKRSSTAGSSLVRLTDLGIPIENQLAKINSCLSDIDQLLIPSTINNIFHQRFILRKEREIISVFEEAEQKALNYLIAHSRLGLLFYKVKDHRNFSGQHRTELIELLAVERISLLTVISRVIVLHALQVMKLPANAKAEYWVRNIILSTKQDDLSDLKTLTDAKGDYFCMKKLIYDDIRSETVRQDILKHFQNQAKVQEAHMKMGTKKSKLRKQKAWRKILSDVDDTLTCSGGSYPSGIDKRYGKKVVYPGVLAFYRELDLGAEGPEEWPANTVGNLVFLSARPHVYKDVSEKRNFAKFEKLRARAGVDGRGGMHTVPSLLAGDLSSGTEFIMKNNFEPLALKKFENFQKYVSIYPEFRHIFVCDNGQGDVRAGELMMDSFPEHLEAIYVHVVQSVSKTYRYFPEKWKGPRPCFFTTYPEAALNAATRKPPLIRVSGLKRICQDAVNDFYMIQTKEWPSQKHKWDRRDELNQALWHCNKYLKLMGEKTVPLLEAERLWRDGKKVSTPFGNGTILSFDSISDLYEIELDWRPLDVQLSEYIESEAEEKKNKVKARSTNISDGRIPVLETVLEIEEEIDDETADASSKTITGAISEKDICPAILEQGYSIEGKPSNSTGIVENPVDSKEKYERDQISSFTNSEPHTNTKDGFPNNKSRRCIISKIQGRHISKFTPPILPTFPKHEEGQSMFSFWGSRAESSKNVIGNIKLSFNVGDKCSTPFGGASIVEYREKDSIVVVEMTGWKAKAYLRQKDVKVGGEGILGSLLRRITTSDNAAHVKPATAKELELPVAKDDLILTPFGEGKISRLPTIKTEKPKVGTLKEASSVLVNGSIDGDKLVSSFIQGPASLSVANKYETVEISLTTWVLANGSKPVLYCPVRTAVNWKKNSDDEDRSKASGGIFSVFGSIVSHSMKLITRQPEKKVPIEIIVPRFQRYYKDGAIVTTSFGDGLVRTFREFDGFYEVSLLKWKMMGNVCPIAFLQKDSLCHCIANGCHEGYPVMTSFGLTGILASVEPTTGVHIVTVPSARMVCYLQPKDVLRPLKAAVGEIVLTQYGEGKVQKYRSKDDIYEIKLSAGQATLYAKAEAFDRVNDNWLEDQVGQIGIKWLLRRFLFFSSENGEHQRSRSNSVASVSVRSQSSRSII